MEPVPAEVPTEPEAGGGLERDQRDPPPPEGRSPRPLEEASGGRGEEARQEAGGGEDHGGGGYPCGYHGVLQEEPGRAQPDVGTEERCVRGGIWRLHGAKFAAPQQRGVEAGEPQRMQVIFARMSLDEIVKYITVELKLNAKNEAHVQDRHGHGQRGHREDRHHREIQEDTANSAEDGSGSGQDHWTGSREDHEEAHFFAFVAHNVRDHGQDRSRWSRIGPKKSREPRRIGNPPLSFREYRSQHDGCWVCYGKGNNHAHDHRQCKVYEADKKAYFAAHPEKKPKEQRIFDWKAKGGDGGKGQGKGQGKGGGRGYGGGPGQDRRVRSIE